MRLNESLPKWESANMILNPSPINLTHEFLALRLWALAGDVSLTWEMKWPRAKTYKYWRGLSQQRA